MRIGVCVPIGERGPERKPNPYAEMRAIAVAADTHGLDSIWVADHLFIHNERGENRGLWEAVAMLGALADATTRVELGPLVFCAPFRNPGLLAWSANTLDEIERLAAGEVARNEIVNILALFFERSFLVFKP